MRARGKAWRWVWLDHESDGLLPEALAHTYFTWRIDARRSYLIEAVRSAR
ncbi:MAG TPA: hypothetical protein VGM44_25535 [Polyangiaceae bacterium]|jgi:hypothetical protein